MVVEEALELLGSLVEATDQLIHIISSDLLGNAVEILNLPEQAQLLLYLLIALGLEVTLDDRLVKLIILPPEGRNTEGFLNRLILGVHNLGQFLLFLLPLPHLLLLGQFGLSLEEVLGLLDGLDVLLDVVLQALV